MFRPLIVAGALVTVCACRGEVGDIPGPDPEPQPDSATVSVAVRAYVSGALLYLEQTLATDTVRLALDTRWGGTIVELSRYGVNVVNAHDVGREIQAAFYDGSNRYDACAGCSGTWGWDPVQGGDQWDAGSTVLASSLAGDSLYVRVRPLEWNPDDKGGGPGQPVASDVILEQWVAAVPATFSAFRVRYRLTHLGSDDHAAAGQEIPAVYANVNYDRLAVYGGSAPWTNGPVTLGTLAQLGSDLGPERRASEYWAALVDATGRGVMVYMPGSMPYVNGFLAPGASGPTGDGTTYFRALTPVAIGPAAVITAQVYVIVGPYTDARKIVYALRPAGAISDILTPIGSLDEPVDGATVAGITSVAGWAWDNVAVTRVDVLVDGTVFGTATYGLERPDVAAAYPGAPLKTGYGYGLDTSTLTDGAHAIAVMARDAAGNVGRFSAGVQVANQAGARGPAVPAVRHRHASRP